MTWTKLGRIFQATGQTPWLYSHTAMPMPLFIIDNIYRIYFGSRNEHNQPYISYIELDITAPDQILKISDRPILGPGKPGYFDDNGLYPGSIITMGSKLLMYYMGRSNGENGMYYMAIGLAESEDGGLTYTKISDAPIMGRSQYDPWMVTTPWVITGKDVWKMWYTSGIGWSSDLKTSYYHIKSTTSTNGKDWVKQDCVSIPLSKDETNVAAPSVICTDDKYEMWFSYVTQNSYSYQLGYAVSNNGLNWNRLPMDSNLALSEEGWDSTCMAYPSVFEHKDKLYMLYSGNELGKQGIGLAVRDD